MKTIRNILFRGSSLYLAILGLPFYAFLCIHDLRLHGWGYQDGRCRDLLFAVALWWVVLALENLGWLLNKVNGTTKQEHEDVRLIFHPVEDCPPREFAIKRDAYGLLVLDIESGLSVTLDWNGGEVKAIVTAEGGDEPTFTHTLVAPSFRAPRA